MTKLEGITQYKYKDDLGPQRDGESKADYIERLVRPPIISNRSILGDRHRVYLDFFSWFGALGRSKNQPPSPLQRLHWSDCAVHNEPAYPNGPCDCGGLDLAGNAHHRFIVAFIFITGRTRLFIEKLKRKCFVKS